jgi:replicative DNA helicase
MATPHRDNLPDRMPPQSIESEKALLGSLMLDKETIWKVVDFLEGRDFYKHDHQLIYQAMTDLATAGEPIDIRTLSNKLKEASQLKQVGGHGYLTELVNSVPTASNALAYAKAIQKKRILRDLISASYDIGKLGYNEREDVTALLDTAEKTIFKIAQKGVTQTFTQLKSALGPAFERMANLADDTTGKLSGIPTGFRNLDNLLAGLQASDLIILAARPSFGKSSLALNIAKNVAVNEKKPVGIFSLEMSAEQVVDRLIASQSRTDLWRIRTGRLSREGSPNDFDIINQALDQLSDAPIFIDDTSSPTVLQIKAMARRLQAEHGLSLLVIDYLQLIQPVSSYDSVVQQVSQISRALKDIARELRVPVLALSQLSRAVEQRTPPIPRLSDLRESGSLEQDSDVVMFINRPDKYDTAAVPNMAEINIAKHRNGPTGMRQLMFNDSIVSFEMPADEPEEEATPEAGPGDNTLQNTEIPG